MDHLVTLGTFLRSCRARPLSDEVGMPRTGRRRVSSLRRKELAQLASMSVDYLTRLEQGRVRTASHAVLDSLAATLRLDDAKHAHLFDLAADPLPPLTADGRVLQRVSETTYWLLSALDDARGPAFVLGRHTDVLAGNRLAAALITDFTALAPRDRNQDRFVFLAPYTQELYGDWESAAADNAAMLRMEEGRRLVDRVLDDLVSQLAKRSPEFRALWGEQRVTARTEGTKVHHHLVAGALTVSYQAMAIAGQDDQTLFVYTTPPACPDKIALRLLATWETSRTRTEQISHRGNRGN